MHSKINTVKELLAQGENISVEFKQQDVHPDSLAKEIVAFLNTPGGQILIGVTDEGKISGISKDKDWDIWISNITRNNILPAAQINIQKVPIEDKEILLLEVPKGKEKPYQTSKNQFIIRVGSTNRTATQQEILRLFQNAGFFHFDSTGIENTNIKNLDFYRLNAYFEKYSIDLTHEANIGQILQNVDILTPQTEKLTVAGNLVFGLSPQRFMINAGITIAAFKGQELSEELLHQTKIDGTLPSQVDQTLQVLKGIIPVASTIVGAKRTDTVPGYSEKVLRELTVNAVVHRDYSISGSRIRIFRA